MDFSAAQETVAPRITLLMAPLAAFLVALISLLICTALAGMVAAWTWAIGRLWAGQPLLPPAKSRTVPWGVGSVLLALVVWFVINIAVSLVYFGLTGKIRDLTTVRKPTLTEQMTLLSVMNGVLLVALPLTLRRTAGARLAAFGLESGGLARQVLAGTVGFLLATPLVYMVNLLAVLMWKQHKHPLEQMIMAEPNAGIACLALLSAVLLAPAAEELMFRGILQNWLDLVWHRGDRPDIETHDIGPEWSSTLPPGSAPEIPATAVPEAVTPVAVEGELFPGRWMAPAPDREVGQAEVAPFPSDGPRSTTRVLPWRESMGAIVTTSALFAAVHLPQWPAPIAIFLLSLVLGVLYQRTGSLIASFMMHALFNGFSTLLLFQAVLIGAPSETKIVPTATCVRFDTSVNKTTDTSALAALGRQW